MKKTITAILLITLIYSLVYSDTIIMKNGDYLKGKIIFQNEKVVKIKTKFGKVTVPKIEIKTIKMSVITKPKEIVYIKLKSNKKISGIIIQQNSEKMILTHNNTTITISKKNISQLSWEPIIETKKVIYLKKSTKWDSIWRSTVLPSWGQFHNKKKTKGIIIASVIGLLSIATITSQIDYNSKLNDYNNAIIKSDALFNTAEDARKRTNNLIVGLSIAWILNIADAVLFSSNETKKIPPLSGLQSPQLNAGIYGLEFFKRF